MLERRSALASVEPLEASSIRIAEARDFSLLQIIKPTKAAQAALGKLPKSAGQAIEVAGRTLIKTGVDQYWVVGPSDDGIASQLQGNAIITPLSHSRTRIMLEGARARSVLARSAALDFHPQSFGAGAVAMTGIHHTPALIHCTDENTFHIYAMRTFALSLWEWLVDAAID